MPNTQTAVTTSVGQPAPAAPTATRAGGDVTISLALILSVCGAVVAIGTAVGVVYKLIDWIQSRGVQRAQRDSELANLRKQVEDAVKSQPISDRYARNALGVPPESTAVAALAGTGIFAKQEELARLVTRVEAIEELLRGLHQEVDGVINKVMDMHRDTNVFFAKVSQDLSQRDAVMRDSVHVSARETRQDLERRIDSTQRTSDDKLNVARETLSTDCARLDSAQRALQARLAELDKQYTELYGKYQGLRAAVNSLPTLPATVVQASSRKHVHDSDSADGKRA